MILLTRHSQSTHNTGEWAGPTTAQVPITKAGAEQGRILGAQLLKTHGIDFFSNTVFLESTFLRARQTLDEIFVGAGVSSSQLEKINRAQDPRLEELDFGGEEWTEKSLWSPDGIWRHVFASGKSFATDGRRSIVPLVRELKEQYPQDSRPRLLVTHGWTILTIIMEWFALPDEMFARLRNIENCGLVTIDRTENLKVPMFQRESWGISGIQFR